VGVGENRLKAKRARSLSVKERGAKPETELALPRWGKASVFSKIPTLTNNLFLSRKKKCFLK
jgi:hypothetical protein